jgi:transaldolase
LWASTGTKNPAYSDLLYVEQLIMPDVVNTMPEATLRAFADHGESARIAVASDADSTILASVEHAGIDLTALTADLEREGVRAFCASYRALLACLTTKVHQLEVQPVHVEHTRSRGVRTHRSV